MFSMAMLTRAADVRYARVDMGVDDWLTEAQLGFLDAFNWIEESHQNPTVRDVPGAFNGVRKAPRHPTVNRVALSQKGPVLRYSEANVLRSFVMQTARRWFFNDVFSFQPPSGGGVATELLDRLLASLPYPAADYDAQNPFNPFRRTPWTQSRRRMDMLYGRDFNAENLAPQTLEAIDDLFGPMHMDTVAQTIHFARFNVITNQRGAGEFFTLGRLRQRWNVASTFAFHGRDNGLVDVSTNALLKERFKAAGVDIQLKVFDHKGHQDVFIGSDSQLIYDTLTNFLDKETPEPRVNPSNASLFSVTLPWMGPRFQMGTAGVQIAARSRPDQGDAVMVLVPVSRAADTVKPLGDVWAWSGRSNDAREWHFATPSLTPLGGPNTNGTSGWLALFLYGKEEMGGIVDRTFGGHLDPSAERTNFPFETASGVLKLSDKPARVLEPISPDVLSDTVKVWINGQSWAALQQAFVSLNDIQSAVDLLEADSSEVLNITFALGSCQYPAGLWDALPANQSLEHLATHANQDGQKPEDPPPINFAIFSGDQIYADATAGLADPVRRDERFQVPHERALRQPGLRAVLRQMPTAMLLDDHEITDNWTRLAPDHPDHDSNQKQRERALEAFQLYQRMDNKFRATDSHTTADQTFVWGGLPVYLLDTRSARQPRRVGEPAHIISRQQRCNLEHWLNMLGDTPKCIVTPSLFLPRRSAHLSGHRSDAFDGYAESQGWLIDLLLQKGAHHTLFLSGDEHCSMVCQTKLKDRHCANAESTQIELVSIHSSALYAPYPFANGRADNLVAQENFVTPSGQSEVEVVATQFSPGDGYARISLTRSAAGVPQVTLWFHKANGNATKLGPFPF
jgi:cholesterol oxidase